MFNGLCMLYVFISGSQVTLGQTAISFAGVNFQLRANLDDQDFAVRMKELPLSKSTPTTTSCIIAHIKLARISNSDHAELPTQHRPIYGNAIKLEEDISLRLKDLTPFFDQNISVEPHLELPRRIILWRSFHLRIVLNRPSLFEAM